MPPAGLKEKTAEQIKPIQIGAPPVKRERRPRQPSPLPARRRDAAKQSGQSSFLSGLLASGIGQRPQSQAQGLPLGQDDALQRGLGDE